MINKIKSIGNFGVFKEFEWDKEVIDKDNNPQAFQAINIIYGRNYSGKTSLSRILRFMETGEVSDKFENPSFCVKFSDGKEIKQDSFPDHEKILRVFNEDFVRENLQFITNPDESITSFAILGESNNRIEKEIEAIDSELGSDQEGAESGLYAERVKASRDSDKARLEYQEATKKLDRQLSEKATDREIGIKYKPERFGDQNYTVAKLRRDITAVQGRDYSPPTDDELEKCEKLISEVKLEPVPTPHLPNLGFSDMVKEAEALLARKVGESGKIEDLVKDAVLNRWAHEGRSLHKDKRSNCGFCGNVITQDRWSDLDRHFDEESDDLEKDIDGLISRLGVERNKASNVLSIDKSRFYSKFHDKLEVLDKRLTAAIGEYERSIDMLLKQLKSRKASILAPVAFAMPPDRSEELVDVLSSYRDIVEESSNFSDALRSEQSLAKETLRLKEVFDYLATIKYEDQLSTIDARKKGSAEAHEVYQKVEDVIHQKRSLAASKKRQLNDEEKGAQKVNEYLNHCFGHEFLSLQAKQDKVQGEGGRKIRFEIIRDGKKAYHLSEGECSLVAFCYFLAKLDDIDTKGSKPIIWIDDPISSLDGNHIFFVYSLISTEIVAAGRFEQLFLSTHDLDFLKYLKRMNGEYIDSDQKRKSLQKAYFIIARQGRASTLRLMPNYLKEYVTEFNYLFHQIYKCAEIDTVDDSNYATFYNFANNARKFFEVYLYYKYPDQGMTPDTLRLFFGDDSVPAVLTDRMNNEYSHLSGVFERGATPVEVPEMQTAAKQIIQKLKEERDQYSALLRSIGVTEQESE